MWRRVLLSLAVLSCGVGPAADSNGNVAKELSLTFGNAEVTGGWRNGCWLVKEAKS